MNRSKIAFLLVAALCSLAGCSAGGQDEAGAATTLAQSSPSDKGAEPVPMPKALPRKIIYKAEATLITENYDQATERLEAKLKDLGGYISSSEQSGSTGIARQGTWSLRVPSDKFDILMKSLSTLGELQSVSRHAEDVSEEFYDVQARLKNKHVEEDRILQLLQHRSGDLSEVLTLERELSRVQEESERIEGRLKFLANQTDLSTINLTISEIKAFAPKGSPDVSTKVGRSFGGSVDLLKTVGTGMLMLLVAVIPWIVPFSFVVWLYMRARKPRKQMAE